MFDASGDGPSRATSSESDVVLEQALRCLANGQPDALVGPTTTRFSERCVEVPWVAAHLANSGRLLDIGWAMSPPEWLGVLLAVQDHGASLTGIDIIDPQRVRSRYPVELLERVLAVPVRVESFLDASPTDGTFDTITCVSTLEHIGFDQASPPEVKETAFVRSTTPDGANGVRDPQTDALFLDAAHRMLSPGGSLLLSVPVGHGVPILHQDSLGLFTHQFEYDDESWNRLVSDDRFEVREDAYFRHDQKLGWVSVPLVTDLTDQTSALRPFATGCAVAHLVRR